MPCSDNVVNGHLNSSIHLPNGGGMQHVELPPYLIFYLGSTFQPVHFTCHFTLHQKFHIVVVCNPRAISQDFDCNKIEAIGPNRYFFVFGGWFFECLGDFVIVPHFSGFQQQEAFDVVVGNFIRWPPGSNFLKGIDDKLLDDFFCLVSFLCKYGDGSAR